LVSTCTYPFKIPGQAALPDYAYPTRQSVGIISRGAAIRGGMPSPESSINSGGLPLQMIQQDTAIALRHGHEQLHAVKSI
jgi:hypothetical protein